MKKNMNQKKNGAQLKSTPKSRVKAEVIKAPIAQSRRISGLGEPKFRSIGAAGDVCVIHREYVSDLLASATAGAFGVLGIPINPGNLLLFPWLSKMAENFESYVFKGLKFLFETDAPSTTPGTVLMAVDYDAVDALPSSKGDMMSYRGATRTVPWARQELQCGKEDLHKRKTYYIRDLAEDQGTAIGGHLTNGEDPRLDDVGTLIVGSSNCASNALLGELYVEYEVELMTPKAGNGAIGAYHIQALGSALGISALAPLGTTTEFTEDQGDADANPRVYEGLPIRYLLSSGTTSAIQFQSPGKTYLVSIDFQSNTGVTTAPAFGVASSQLAIDIQTGLQRSTTGGTAFAVVSSSQSRDNISDYGRLTISQTGLTSTVNSSNDLWVTQLPNWSEFPFRTSMQPKCLRWSKSGKRRHATPPPLGWFSAPSDPRRISPSNENSCCDKLAELGQVDNLTGGEKEEVPSRHSTALSAADIRPPGIGNSGGNKQLQMR